MMDTDVEYRAGELKGAPLIKFKLPVISSGCAIGMSMSGLRQYCALCRKTNK